MKLLLCSLIFFSCIKAYPQSDKNKEKALAMRQDAAAACDRAWDTDQYIYALSLAKKAFNMERCYDAYIIRGTGYKINKKMEDALADFNKAIEMEPSNIRGYYKRGYTYQAIGKINEALADFKTITALAPTSSWGYLGTAICLRQNHDYDNSQIAYLKALELGASKPEMFVALGTLNQDRKNYKEAAEWYTKELALKKDDEYTKKLLEEVSKYLIAEPDKINKNIAVGCISGDCNNGLGTTYQKSSDNKFILKYTGQFVNGKENGQGFWIDSVLGEQPSVWYYQGNFLDDKRNGKGKQWKIELNKENNKWIKTNEWFGEFSNNVLSGYDSVVMYNKSGTISQIYTGNFLKDVQQDGKKIYITLGNYYNGTWESDAWSRTGAPVGASFTPAGTKDKIEGNYDAKEDICPFQPDGKYYSTHNKKSKTYPFNENGPAWLYETWWPAQLAAIKADKLKNLLTDEQIEKRNAKMEEERKQNLIRYPAGSVGRGSTNGASNSSKSNSISEHNCPRCNGSGRDNVTDRYGNTTRKTCGLCNGSGKAH